MQRISAFAAMISTLAPALCRLQIWAIDGGIGGLIGNGVHHLSKLSPNTSFYRQHVILTEIIVLVKNTDLGMWLVASAWIGIDLRFGPKAGWQPIVHGKR